MTPLPRCGHAEVRERCLVCYVDRGLERPEWFKRGGATKVKPAPLPLVRPSRCEHLGDVLVPCKKCQEMKRLHECDKGHEAVPAGSCQDCGDYAPLDGVPWVD